MKNIVAAVTGGLLLLGLTACSGDGSGSGEAASGQEPGTPGKSMAETAKPGQNAPGDASGSTPGDASGHMSGAASGDGTATAPGGKTTIVFSTFFPDTRFQEAKTKYEAMHPNVEIRLESVQTDDANVEADLEKFETTMNAAMLAGKGPDLLEMDKLPTDRYVQRGLLADLNKLIEQDPSFRKDDYFANILDNSKVGGGLYGMPLSFFLFGLAGDEDAIAQAGVKIDDMAWSWNDFAQIAKKLVNGVYPHVINTTPEYMLMQMVTDHYSLFIDEAVRRAHFDTATFTALMQQVKTMADEGIIGEGRPYFFPVQINSPGDYLTSLKSYLAPNVKLYIKPHAQDVAAGGYFRSYRTVGLNANSQVKQQAWDFIKFMMSEEIETLPNSAGFPINQNAFAKEMERLKAEGSVPTVPEGPLHGAPVPVDPVKLEVLESFLTGAIHAVSYKPSEVEQIVVAESKAFFSGQKSAEDVAKLIQNKVTTYLNE